MAPAAWICRWPAENLNSAAEKMEQQRRVRNLLLQFSSRPIRSSAGNVSNNFAGPLGRILHRAGTMLGRAGREKSLRKPCAGSAVDDDATGRRLIERLPVGTLRARSILWAAEEF